MENNLNLKPVVQTHVHERWSALLDTEGWVVNTVNKDINIKIRLKTYFCHCQFQAHSYPFPLQLVFILWQMSHCRVAEAYKIPVPGPWEMCKSRACISVKVISYSLLKFDYDCYLYTQLEIDSNVARGSGHRFPQREDNVKEYSLREILSLQTKIQSVFIIFNSLLTFKGFY